MAQALNDQQLIFSGTTAHQGRKTSVFPGNSQLRHLHYGRILLDSTVPHVSFATGARETALLCMHGGCTLKVDGAPYTLAQYDAIYVPRDSAIEVTTDAGCDLVECAAEVDGDYPLQLVPYEQVKQNPAQKFTAGGASTSRDLNIVIGDNVKAGRILMGFTKSQPGNWTSWPPHEHTELLEELYVYFDMPAPAFGIQLVYTSPETPEFVSIVREGDAVLMPAGYHPNVAAPGHGINFIWMMAAHREVQDRLFGVVNVQPGFDQKGSGLEASQGTALASDGK
jgi:5-deoxy-glucuronate isomerase